MIGRISLNGEDWLFKDFYGADWVWRRACAPDTADRRWWRRGSVPGSVLNDLWMLGEIENPYFEKNSFLCEWVPQRTWVYKKSFTLDAELESQRVQLLFLGVDYAAQFYLNGEYLGYHEGMYTPVVFDLTGRLKFETENILGVVIEAAPQEQPQVGYTSRVHTHKSRMGYWWDFCPRLVHQGIWQDVCLDVSGPVRIDTVFVRPRLNETFDQAWVDVSVDVDALGETAVDVDIVIQSEQVEQARWTDRHILAGGPNRLDRTIELPSPKLWWPNGCGRQDLYQAEVTIRVGGQVSQRKQTEFGVRRIEVCPNESAEAGANPYTFVVNGRKVYIKGWNWVPVDALYGAPREDKLDRLLSLAQQAHVNMLRVWGGGLIEKEAFYTACDRLGIMVWQEFIQSSSGIENRPPDSADFIRMLVDEAERIIPLKRNHPSLAVWCGGNELQTAEETPVDDTHPTLAALKQTVKRLDPDRLWFATSPTGRVFSNSLKNIRTDAAALHDVHGPWEYQGPVKQYELYNHGASLFHSEFGVEGITNRKTLDAVISPHHQWPVSLDENPYWWHLGAWWVQRGIWDQAFGALDDVESYIRATQFTQYDGLRYALEADRRRKYHNSGSLPWQFNEPYPMAACTSAVDYHGQPKPVYYAVAHAYEPVHISAQFDRLVWADQHQFEAGIWVCNSNVEVYPRLSIDAHLVEMNGRQVLCCTSPVSIPANRAIHVFDFECDLDGVEPVFFLDLRLTDECGVPISANRYTFTRAEQLIPLLQAPVADVETQVERLGDTWNLEICNPGTTTAMYIWLQDGREIGSPGFAYVDQNYFCLFPGERRQVRVDWRRVEAAERRLEIGGWNTNRMTVTERGLYPGGEI